MSTEQPLDPQLIEQTKQQIRSLYAEIAQLARSDIGPDEFYAEMLPRVITALAAIGGVVWAKQEQGQLALQYQVNLKESRLAEKDAEDQLRHGRLLQKVMATGEGLLVPPHSGAADSDQAANPTDWLLVLGPLKTELEVVGVVEVFQRPEAGPAIQRGYLRFLLEVCALASEFLNSRQLRHFSDRQALWTQLEEFTRLVHASLNPRETAYTIANEGRRLIECDRVSVALRKGDKCTIEAVSGQDMVDKRSNVVRLLGRLATVVVASEEPMWYTGDTRDMAPQVEDAVQEYVDESHTKMIAVLPLKRVEPGEKERERPGEPLPTERPIGALIVEQIEDSRLSQRLVSRVEVVAQHSATALANAMEHENIFLMPLWRTLGKARWVTEVRNLPKVSLVGAAVLALIVGLVTVPYDFNLHAKGTLEPVLKSRVFAGTDGVVQEVRVDHGDSVRKGDILVLLQNHKLSEEITLARGNLLTTAAEVSRIRQQLTRHGRLLTPEESIRLNGELMAKESELASLRSQLRIYTEQEKELEVRSPTDGVVLTWKIHELLTQRPVQRGQELMEVADPSGPWQLELQMSDDRMGHIARAQNAVRTKVRARLREVLLERMREPLREKLREELRRQAEANPSPKGTTGAGSNETSGRAEPGGNEVSGRGERGGGGSGESVSPSPSAPPEAAATDQPAPPQKQPHEPSPPAAPPPSPWPSPTDGSGTSENRPQATEAKVGSPTDTPKGSGPSGMPPVESPSEPQGVVRIAPAAEGEPRQAESAPGQKPVGEGGAQKPAVPGEQPSSGEAGWQPPVQPEGEKPSAPAEQPDSAAPHAQPPALPEAPPQPPRADEALEARVAELLPGRLEQEVEAELARIPDDQLSEKLWELSGEQMEDRLRVAYILATDPATTHYGYIEEIHEMAEVRGEEGNTVLIKVAINKEDLSPEHIRPGASVTAKVQCGRRAVGYVWFHDLIAFVRKMWFRWFY